jgi:hypothetical protein
MQNGGEFLTVLEKYCGGDSIAVELPSAPYNGVIVIGLNQGVPSSALFCVRIFAKPSIHQRQSAYCVNDLIAAS